MPVITCQRDGKPWYKWWAEWNCYTYTSWDAEERKNAKEKAEEQWRAIEVNKESEAEMKIIKTDSWFNTVLFVALVPFEKDRNWDIITDEEITKTAHDFVRNLAMKKVNVDHEDDSEVEDAEFVESFIAPVEIPVGLETIPKWAWVVWIRFDDETYKAIQEGDYIGISIEWKWNREEMSKS